MAGRKSGISMQVYIYLQIITCHIMQFFLFTPLLTSKIQILQYDKYR